MPEQEIVFEVIEEIIEFILEEVVVMLPPTAIAERGEQGPAGPAGPAGADGADGADGIQGPAGPAGADGADGIQGPAGPAGADGAAGIQGPVGPAGADGADGAQGPIGPAGALDPATPEQAADGQLDLQLSWSPLRIWLAMAAWWAVTISDVLPSLARIAAGQGGDFTVSAAMLGKTVPITATALVTIPAALSVGFPEGAQVRFANISATATVATFAGAFTSEGNKLNQKRTCTFVVINGVWLATGGLTV